MGKNIFTVTFCVTNWFQIRSHFKRKKIINKYKKLQHTHISFPFHHGSYLEGTCTQQVFKFCLCNQSAEKHFHSSQHVENGRKKTFHMCIQFQVPRDLLTFI